MSLPLTDDNGVVQTVANGTPVSWSAGLGYDASGLLCVTGTLSATDVWINGWRRDIQGRLVVSQSFPEGQPFIYNAGWPTDKNTGAIITQQNIPAPTDPRIAGVAVGPLGGVYMTEGGYIWSPLALWPDGIASPGMWISPSALDASFNDSTGTTPVATPGTVADSANPVGLALDIRAGATALADPGNHMLQATATARPLESARVNLVFGKSEDFSDPLWAKSVCTISANAVTAPDGTLTADKMIPNTGSVSPYVGHSPAIPVLSGLSYKASWRVKAGDFRYVSLFELSSGTGAGLVIFDLQSATVSGAANGAVVANGSIVSLGDGWYELAYTYTSSTTTNNPRIQISGSGTAITNVTGDGTSGLYLWGGSLVTAGQGGFSYQSVVSDSSYTATGFPIYQKYDGTDDGMATASFAAGPLINGMDCMIAVRRDSAANAVCGLYESVSDANKVFGIAESGSSSGCVGSGAGTPTVWVDNVQLTGGTAVTRGTLHTALTTGAWHILEFRGLDLSTWTASGFGLYTSYKLLGARGDIMLFPSTADATDRDNARQYLADLYGVTLPAWVGRYNYVTPPTSSIPAAGGIVHGDNLLNKLNFSKTDLDGQTYTGPPLTTGHEVKIGDQVYTLVAPPVDFSSYITLTIEPATQLADGTYPVLVY